MTSIRWKELSQHVQFDKILELSKKKPVLVFKHKPTSPESISVKKRFEAEWDIQEEFIELFLLEDTTGKNLIKEVIESAGVDDEFPQVLLFADGVAMYDESHDMISAKKINIALKIINRTFKWMESRA
ncbi:MAG: DUF2847 family protein [Cyclobacteriaceae bacterium]|nr:DUF2847 family protein [Cyclobacteriaceae bacterium]